MKTSEPCPVCKSISETQGASIDGTMVFHFICPRCGEYQIEYVAKAYLNVQLDQTKVAILSHAIRKMQRNSEIPLLDQGTVALILQEPLPKPVEQINNFVIWLGDHIPSLGSPLVLDSQHLQAEIGAVTQDGLQAIVKHLLERKIVQGGQPQHINNDKDWEMTLTIEGWEFYEKLKQGGSLSRKAFIAMRFGDEELDTMLINCFRPAVKATGYELFRLDDVPKAGLIDDRLRVEIKSSRFLIADLTHENAGAYWEAGYAEGLGKPVIYTCEKNKFDKKKTHFDTNHHTTVLWDKDDLEKTARDLKNTIRATLPEEAKLTDDE